MCISAFVDMLIWQHCGKCMSPCENFEEVAKVWERASEHRFTSLCMEESPCHPLYWSLKIWTCTYTHFASCELCVVPVQCLYHFRCYNSFQCCSFFDQGMAVETQCGCDAMCECSVRRPLLNDWWSPASVVIVWRVRGKTIRSVLCSSVCNNCAQCDAHIWTD